MGETLLPILVFPLLVPMVIYGVSATGRLLAGRPVAEVAGNLRMLAAFAVLAVVAGAVPVPLRRGGMMPSKTLRTAGPVLAALGVVGMLVLHWMVFFWVPTEANQGVIQRIFYVHVPSAVVAFLGLRHRGPVQRGLPLAGRRPPGPGRGVRRPRAGMVFTTIVLLTGPLWGRSPGAPTGPGSPA